jgi:hypothetical protein
MPAPQLIQLNREDRRYLEAILRSDAEEGWFVVEVEENVDFMPDDVVELNDECEGHVVTVEIAHADLLTLERATQERCCDAAAPKFTLQQHTWRWSDKRQGWYAEVPSCRWCDYIHIPVLTQAAIAAILAAGREKGLFPR